MYRVSWLALASVLCLLGCSNSDTAPSATAPKFGATLLPSNEVPPVSNGDQTGSGTVVITLNETKDSSGNITSATADFTVTLTGFPAPTTLTAAHIHQGVVGVNASPLISLGLTSGEIVLANGSGTFTKTGIPVTGDQAQALLNTPSNFYFNVHTTINTPGAARGQLARTN